MVNLKKILFGLLVFCSMLFVLPNVVAQTTTKAISGVVVDDKGDPLIGVSVLVKGTTTGTITDVNGKFALPAVSAKNSILVFTYIGYDAQEVSSKGQILRVQLVEKTKSLEEVVVVGYGTQRKKDLTGSVATIKSSDIKSLPVPSVSDALQGRAAGVQVISSGTPGTDATFRIRGTGTINDANPLVVIDGLPIDGGLNQLNMDDIESMQILKDASATAIYGSRGANGVIIITTKHGTDGKSQINFNYSYGVQDAAKIPKMLNASQFATLHNEMLSNAGLTQNPEFADPTSLGVGTDWLGAFFRTAPMQNYSLNYSGGTDKSHIYVSGNYFNQDGIVINTGFKRYTFQLNTDSKVTSFLKFGNNLTLNHDIKYNGDYSIRNAMLALPTQAIYHQDGSYTGPVGQPINSGDITNPIGAAKTVEN